MDHQAVTIRALEPDDDRAAAARVAGPAALFVAKAHKIGDRLRGSRPDRLIDKDAADVVRLMQTTAPRAVGATLRDLARHEMAGEVTAAAITMLDTQFGGRGRPGIAMATRALRIALPAERVEGLCLAYTTEPIDAAAGS